MVGTMPVFGTILSTFTTCRFSMSSAERISPNGDMRSSSSTC